MLVLIFISIPYSKNNAAERARGKYGFRLKDCQRMTTETLQVYHCENGREIKKLHERHMATAVAFLFVLAKSSCLSKLPNSLCEYIC